MTPEMVFECVVVSADVQVLSVVTRVLDRLSVDLKICTSTTRALELLSECSADLVVVDWKEDRSSTELLNSILNCDRKRKPVIVTIADSAATAATARETGAHVILEKPLTPESGLEGLRSAYSKMVREERRNARFAVMKFVMAKTEAGQDLPVTITDIGERGLGFLTKQRVEVGSLLTCNLLLPDESQPIKVEARVIWIRGNNLAGADFAKVSPADLRTLHRWLTWRVKGRKRTATSPDSGERDRVC